MRVFFIAQKGETMRVIENILTGLGVPVVKKTHKISVVKDLLKNPDNYILTVYVENGEIVAKVRKNETDSQNLHTVL